MNPEWTAPFLIILPVYLAALGLFHFMIFRVNKHLPPEERIPHSLYLGSRDRLRDEYQRLYPRSRLYPLTMALSVAFFAAGLAFSLWRIWDYVSR